MYILVDAKNICYISYFGYPDLSADDIGTAISYGVFTFIKKTYEKFGTNEIHFFWDGDKSFRRMVYPEYKMNRNKERLPNELFEQIDQTKENLKSLGFPTYSQRGYEADDLIAYICNKHIRARKIIISNDKDLFQCLDYLTDIYDPRKNTLVKKDDFSKEWSIGPPLWAEVKAMAGCSSDNIKGIPGIGEKTAAKKFNGELTERQKKLIKENQDVFQKNLSLVRLPYKGPIPIKIKLQKPSFKYQKFENLFVKLSMNSLLKNHKIWSSLCGE